MCCREARLLIFRILHWYSRFVHLSLPWWIPGRKPGSHESSRTSMRQGYGFNLFLHINIYANKKHTALPARRFILLFVFPYVYSLNQTEPNFEVWFPEDFNFVPSVPSPHGYKYHWLHRFAVQRFDPCPCPPVFCSQVLFLQMPAKCIILNCLMVHTNIYFYLNGLNGLSPRTNFNFSLFPNNVYFLCFCINFKINSCITNWWVDKTEKGGWFHCSKNWEHPWKIKGS